MKLEVGTGTISISWGFGGGEKVLSLATRVFKHLQRNSDSDSLTTTYCYLVEVPSLFVSCTFIFYTLYLCLLVLVLAACSLVAELLRP